LVLIANSLAGPFNINEDYGIQGFNSVYGTSKMILTFTTQAYAPKDVLGFRTEYFNYSIALLEISGRS
jgi:hypothetical protein